MNKNKKEPWRIILALLSIGFIIFLWIKKDIASIYSTMPKEQVAPMIVTTVFVSLLKVAGIAAALLLVKWLVGKMQNRKK